MAQSIKRTRKNVLPDQKAITVLDKYKVASVQASPVFMDKRATIEKGCSLIEEAGRHGATLVVFPETWIPGYPIWLNRVNPRFGYPLANKVYAQLNKNSVDIPGPETIRLGEAAKKASVFVAMGLHERISSGTLYNTILYIGRNGEYLGKHRKLVPTYNERMIWAHGDGSTLGVFDTEIGRLGGLICWEHWMPLARYALYAQGEQIHTSLWPSVSEKFLLACRSMAFEGRLFVIVSGTYMTRSAISDDFEFKKEMGDLPEVLFRGGSAIIGPDAAYLSGPVYDEETILYADIDLELGLQEKQTLDVVGHYARPEVLKLYVNRKAMTPAVFTESDDI